MILEELELKQNTRKEFTTWGCESMETAAIYGDSDEKSVKNKYILVFFPYHSILIMS